jgi:hypothetical protein
MQKELEGTKDLITELLRTDSKLVWLIQRVPIEQHVLDRNEGKQ